MDADKLRKLISVYVPLVDWLALRDEAIKQKIPMTQLCVDLMEAGGMEQIRINNPDRRV